MPQAMRVDLYQPIVSSQGGPQPVALRVAVPNQISSSDGVPPGGYRAETYVLLSSLPDELRRRVEIAVQALITGG